MEFLITLTAEVSPFFSSFGACKRSSETIKVELSFLDLEPPFYGQKKPVPVWGPRSNLTVVFRNF